MVNSWFQTSPLLFLVTVVASGALLIIGSLLSVVVLRLAVAFFRYLYQRRNFTSLPTLRFKKYTPVPIFEVFLKGGVERIIEAIPKRPDGSPEPVYFMGPHFNGQALVVTTDPELIKEIFTNVTDFKKPAFIYEPTKVLLGNGLVTSSGDRWKRQRRLVTPIFHFDRLKAMPRVVGLHMDVFIKEIKEMIASNPSYKLSTTATIRQITLKIIISLGFGGDFDWQWLATRWNRMLASFSRYILGRMLLGELFDYLPIAASTAPFRVRQEISEEIVRVVEKRRQRMQGQHGKLNEEEDSDLLTALLRVKDTEAGGEAIPMEEIIDQSLTFLFAGFDTTSSLLSWTLYYLTRYPQVQERVQAEVDAVLKGQRISNSHMEELTLCRNVLHEVLRLRPVLLGLGREVARDLKLGGISLPKGTLVQAHMYSVHHSPAYWSNPEEFLPDRWSSPETKNMHPFSWIPFSAGPRNCVGRNFALREATIVLAMMMQEFNVEQVIEGPEDVVRMEYQVILEPMNFKVRFSNRKQ